MLQKIKQILYKLGLFNYLKYSKIVQFYKKLSNPELQQQENSELSFYQSFLPQCQLIFDIGANDGHKTIVFTKMGATVIACEPDPFNLDILRSRFRKHKQVIIEPFALTDYVGECNFYIHKPGSALNSILPKWRTILEDHNNSRWKETIKFSDLVIKAKTTTLDALIAKYGIPDYIKIDVEGNELNVIKGLSHPIKVISFEVLLPEFLNEAMACMDLITQNNESALFNYAINEKIMLNEFVSHQKLTNILLRLEGPHLEIISSSTLCYNSKSKIKKHIKPDR